VLLGFSNPLVWWSVWWVRRRVVRMCWHLETVFRPASRFPVCEARGTWEMSGNNNRLTLAANSLTLAGGTYLRTDRDLMGFWNRSGATSAGMAIVCTVL